MSSALQFTVVALLVSWCGGFAAWKLMPAALRRALAAALLRLPRLPAPLSARLARAAAGNAGGCGCDGCDRAAPKRGAAAPAEPPQSQVVVLHRRPRG